MDIKIKLVMFAFDLLVPLTVGYFCRYQTRLSKNFFNKMILNNILIIYPALSFLSFWVLPLRYELIWLPILGLAMGLIPGLIAYLWAEYRFKSNLDRGSYVMSAALSNLGTIGGLCVFLLFGERGYAYQQLIVLFQYILMFMFCYPLAEYYYERDQNKDKSIEVSWKTVLFSRNQLAVLGIISGALINMTGMPRPEPLGALFNPLVHIGAWTALIPVGYSIDFAKLKKEYKNIISLVPVKFFLAPAIIYSLAALVIKDDVMINTVLVLACTPTAVNAVITSRIYNLNVHTSVAAFILTTIIFIAVIYPALFFVLS